MEKMLGVLIKYRDQNPTSTEPDNSLPGVEFIY